MRNRPSTGFVFFSDEHARYNFASIWVSLLQKDTLTLVLPLKRLIEIPVLSRQIG